MDDAKKRQLEFDDHSAVSQPATKEKPIATGLPKRKRHAPLYQYRKEVEKVAVVPVNNTRVGELANKGNKKAQEQPSRPQLPPLPKPSKYRSRLGVFELDLTYPSFRIRREARRAKEAASRGQSRRTPEEPQPSTSSSSRRPCTQEEEDQLYNHFYSVETTTVSTSSKWISSSEDEAQL